jgi:prevent-host-death family protein
MARRVGMRELRDNLSTVMRDVRRGETIEVTHRGEPVAVISPIARRQIDQLVAAGLATPARQSLDLSIEPSPVTGPMTASEALDDDRAER